MEENNKSITPAEEQISSITPSENEVSPSVEVATPEITPSVAEQPAVEMSLVEQPVPTYQVVPNSVEPSCGCSTPGPTNQLVYALGTIGVDYPTEAILDSFKFYMRGIKGEDGQGVQYPDPFNPKHLLSYLQGDSGKDHMYDSTRVTWTISQNGTPIYAIKPAGSFSELTYEKLVDFFAPYDEEENIYRIDLCSFPGYISGSVKLRSGQVIPEITPNLRAMYNWRTKDLVKLVNEKVDESIKEENKEASLDYERVVERVTSKLSFQLQNFGVTSGDRALNHTVTNLYNVGEVIATKLAEGYELDTITVEKSTVCRPDSDCQDVLFSFFNPRNAQKYARHVYRFTVDVSKVIPVSIGTPRDWYVY